MVKVKTLGMIPIAKSFPDTKAHADIPYGYFFTLDGKMTTPPTTDTKKSDMLYVALNANTGDDVYKDNVIRAGDYVNGYLLKAWEGQSLILDDAHIDYKAGEDYDGLVPGATLLGVSESGRLEVIADSAGYGLYFTVADKLRFNGNGVEAKVALGSTTA